MDGRYSFTNLAAGGSYVVAPSLSGYDFDQESQSFANLGNNQTANFKDGCSVPPLPDLQLLSNASDDRDPFDFDQYSLTNTPKSLVKDGPDGSEITGAFACLAAKLVGRVPISNTSEWRPVQYQQHFFDYFQGWNIEIKNNRLIDNTSWVCRQRKDIYRQHGDAHGIVHKPCNPRTSRRGCNHVEGQAFDASWIRTNDIDKKVDAAAAQCSLNRPVTTDKVHFELIHKPTIGSLSRTSATAGSSATTVRLFTANADQTYSKTSVVQWDGSPRATIYKNRNEIQFKVPATDMQSPGTHQVRVFNPNAVGGDGLSEARSFTVLSAPPGGSLSAESNRGKSTTAGVRVLASREITGDGYYRYSYRVINPAGTAALSQIILGEDAFGESVLGIEPIGWSYDNQIVPISSYTAPSGWGISVFADEETDAKQLTWNTRTSPLLGGTELSGFSIVLPIEDGSYADAFVAVQTDGTATNGTVELQGPAPTAPEKPSLIGSVTYGTAPLGQAAKKVPGVSISVAGTVPVNTTTDLDGAYVLSEIGAGAVTITPTKSGDPNGISGLDAARVAQHVAGLIVLNANQIVAGDATDNGSLSGLDAARIAQTAAGLANPGIAGQWKFLPGSRTYLGVANSISGENYEAILVGDVTGNWASAAARSEVGSVVDESGAAESGITGHSISEGELNSIARKPLEVDFKETAIAAGGSGLTIPVSIGDSTGRGIVAYDATIIYDPETASPSDVAVDVAGTLSDGWTVVQNTITPGRVRVTAFSTRPLAGNGVLLNLRFDLLREAERGKASVQIADFVFNEGEVSSTRSGMQTVLGGNTGRLRHRPAFWNADLGVGEWAARRFWFDIDGLR
jgi:hypothetical protein